jgi:hypothetical protein
VTWQVMRWFGQVDNADERWKMDVEKGGASSRPGLFCVSITLVSASVFFPALKPFLV